MSTKPSMDVGVTECRQWHLARGWSDVGYHYIIRRDGTVEEGRSMARNGAHTKGFNKNTVGISYAGGLSEDNKPEDNRTLEQKESLIHLIATLCAEHKTITWIKGHRDFKGVKKSCPCFDAVEEYNGLENC